MPGRPTEGSKRKPNLQIDTAFFDEETNIVFKESLSSEQQQNQSQNFQGELPLGQTKSESGKVEAIEGVNTESKLLIEEFKQIFKAEEKGGRVSNELQPRSFLETAGKHEHINHLEAKQGFSIEISAVNDFRHDQNVVSDLKEKGDATNLLMDRQVNKLEKSHRLQSAKKKPIRKNSLDCWNRTHVHNGNRNGVLRRTAKSRRKLNDESSKLQYQTQSRIDRIQQNYKSSYALEYHQRRSCETSLPVNQHLKRVNLQRGLKYSTASRSSQIRRKSLPQRHSIKKHPQQGLRPIIYEPLQSQKSLKRKQILQRVQQKLQNNANQERKEAAGAIAGSSLSFLNHSGSRVSSQNRSKTGESIKDRVKSYKSIKSKSRQKFEQTNLERIEQILNQVSEISSHKQSIRKKNESDISLSKNHVKGEIDFQHSDHIHDQIERLLKQVQELKKDRLGAKSEHNQEQNGNGSQNGKNSNSQGLVSPFTVDHIQKYLPKYSESGRIEQFSTLNAFPTPNDRGTLPHRNIISVNEAVLKPGNSHEFSFSLEKGSNQYQTLFTQDPGNFISQNNRGWAVGFGNSETQGHQFEHTHEGQSFFRHGQLQSYTSMKRETNPHLNKQSLGFIQYSTQSHSAKDSNKNAPFSQPHFSLQSGDAAQYRSPYENDPNHYTPEEKQALAQIQQRYREFQFRLQRAKQTRKTQNLVTESMKTTEKRVKFADARTQNSNTDNPYAHCCENEYYPYTREIILKELREQQSEEL